MPKHAVKGAGRYHYYVSEALQTGEAASPESTTAASGLRLPAGEIERVVSERVHDLLNDAAMLFELISPLVTDGTIQRHMLDRAKEIARVWSERSGIERRGLLKQIITQIFITPAQVDLHVETGALVALLGGCASEGPQPHVLSVAVKLQRNGHEMRLLVEGVAVGPAADPTLIRLIARSMMLRDKLFASGLSVGALAAREGIGGSYLTRVLRLAFLAPDIVAAILNGRQPVGLTAEKLVRDSRLPLAWAEQKQILGFG